MSAAPDPASRHADRAAGRGPLADLRIIEVGHMLAGPFATMLLADLGAEVIKVESASGDIARGLGPDRVGPHGLYFASLNRNKRSLRLDLASPDGQRALHALVRDAHGLLVNLRPSAIRKLGLTYEALRAHNPRIVCVALTGFGIDGPFADRPAYDYVIQALTGVMNLTGDPGSPPTKAGYSAVDNATGIMAALAMVAKIHEGRGGQVDVALHDTMLAQLNYLAAAGLNGGAIPQRRADGAHPFIVPAQTFATADGHLVLFISHDGFWRLFAEEVGRPGWCTDPRYASMQARTENRDRVVADVQAMLRTDTTANWVARLAPRGIVVSAVSSLDDALASELTRSRQMVVSLDSDAGPIRVLGSPIKIDGYDPPLSPPPLLGEMDEAFFTREDG